MNKQINEKNKADHKNNGTKNGKMQDLRLLLWDQRMPGLSAIAITNYSSQDYCRT